MKYFNSLTGRIEETEDKQYSPIFIDRAMTNDPQPVYTMADQQKINMQNAKDFELSGWQNGQIGSMGQQSLKMPTQGFEQYEQQPQADGQSINQGIGQSELVGASGLLQKEPGVLPSQIASAMGAGGFGTMMSGLKNEMLAGQQEAKLKGEYYKELQDNALKVDAEYKERMAQMQAKTNELMNNITQTQAEISKQAEINPNRWWQSKSSGEQVGAAIAVALGGIGAAMQGTNKNLALERIDQAIERDIMAQESGIRAKKDSLAAQGSLLGLYNQQIGNMDAAKALAKADLYKIAELKLNQQFNGLNGPAQQRAKAQYQQALGQLQVQQQAYTQKAMTTYLEKAQNQQILEGKPIRNPLALPEDKQKNVVKVGNEYFLATGNQAKTTLEEKLPAIMSYQQKGREVLNLIGQGGTKTLNRDEIAKIRTTLADMATSYSRMKGLGSYDDGTARLVESIQGDPTSLFSLSSTDKAKIQRAIEATEIDKQNLLKQNVFGYKGF